MDKSRYPSTSCHYFKFILFNKVRKTGIFKATKELRGLLFELQYNGTKRSNVLHKWLFLKNKNHKQVQVVIWTTVWQIFLRLGSSHWIHVLNPTPSQTLRILSTPTLVFNVLNQKLKSRPKLSISNHKSSTTRFQTYLPNGPSCFWGYDTGKKALTTTYSARNKIHSKKRRESVTMAIFEITSIG